MSNSYVLMTALQSALWISFVEHHQRSVVPVMEKSLVIVPKTSWHHIVYKAGVIYTTKVFKIKMQFILFSGKVAYFRSYVMVCQKVHIHFPTISDDIQE